MDAPTCEHRRHVAGVESRGLSRRRLLTGAAVGAGLFATWRATNALADVAELGDAANANDPARRIAIPPFVPAPSTTLPFEPPAEGEILFPLILGAESTCYVIDNFGDTRGRCCGYSHQGVDIMADLDTPQVAVVDGVLTKRYENTFYGWTLLGDDGVTYKYFHNTPDAAGWSENDRVEQGDVIGFVGDSGTSAGNYHLHFEYRPNNVPADPFDALQRTPGAAFQS
jgi:murein DD-endopeptidase MepM/ murein hydrolase activator NlpD